MRTVRRPAPGLGASGDDTTTVSLAQQLHRGQRGGRGRQREDDEREVQGAAGQFTDQVVGAALLDEQADAGVAVVEGAEHVREQAGAQARGRAQPDPAAAQLDQFLHLVPGRVRVGQDAAGQREQGLTGVREGDVAPGPEEQIRAQLPLQCLDLLGKGRLGDMDQVRGPGEVPGLGDRHEVLELRELHDRTIAAR